MEVVVECRIGEVVVGKSSRWRIGLNFEPG